MTGRAPCYRTLFAEVKRREVFNVAAAYGASAFAVLQLTDIVFPNLGLPEWMVTLVVVVALSVQLTRLEAVASHPTKEGQWSD